MPARFSLGQTVATPGALAALTDSAQSPCEFLRRHISGDWGDVDARKAVHVYPEARPPEVEPNVSIGERGPTTGEGVRSLCRKHGAVIGLRLHPHVFGHSSAKQIFADNGNDLVSLAQILGHENLNTNSRYSQKNNWRWGQSG